MNGFLRYALDYPATIILPACGFLAALVVLRLKARYVRGAAGCTAPRKCTNSFSEERPAPASPQHLPDLVDLTIANSQLVGLTELVTKGAEILLTKDGVPYVALVDAKKLDYYRALETDHRQRILLSDAESGLKDARAGKTISEDRFRKNSRGDSK